MTSIGRLALLVGLTLVASPSSAAPGPFMREGVPRNDVDQATATSIFMIVPIEGPIEDLNVTVNLVGGYSDNMRVTLVHDGASSVLFEGAGNTPDASMRAFFDDEAADAAPTSGAVLGFFRPSGTLSVFDGRELSGLWELRLENVSGAPGDGTDLTFFVLSGRVGYPGPPVVAALYDDPVFVDTTDLSGRSEAENVRAALEASGHDVRRFDGTSAIRFAAALAAADVLVVPELDADLALSLEEDAKGVIADFVAGGGRLVVCSGSAYGANLLNAVLGTSVEILDEDATTSLVGGVGGALGTPFQGGPGELPYYDRVGKISVLPDGSHIAYASGGTIYSVATLPFFDGEAVFLGFDYDDAAPLGSLDGGWLEVLDRAVLGPRAVPSRRVAVYDDPDYVDTGDDLEESEREADTVRESLEALGHSVSRFAGTSAARFASAVAGSQVLLVPELELGDLAPALDAAAEAAIEGFVAGGGVLIVHGDTNGRVHGLLNEVFGWALAPGSAQSSGEPNTLVANNALGTRFAGGVLDVPGNDLTTIVTGIPLEGRGIYHDDGFEGVVARISHGLGQVIYLGWDWWDAAPLGSHDGGWLEVLNRSVLEAPEPDATVLALAAIAALGALRRRRGAGLLVALAVVAGSVPARSEPLWITGTRFEDVDQSGTTVVPLIAPVEGPIEDLDLVVQIGDGYVDNLRLTLVHRGVEVVVYEGTGDTSMSFTLATFDDESDTPYPSTGGLDGTYQPRPGSLSAFDGLELSGRWELRIENVAGLPGDGTDLHSLSLLGEVGLTVPPVAVAVLDDPAFVDTTDPASGSSEAENVKAVLAEIGHDVRPFTGASAAALSSALAGAGVLLVPEFELGDLVAVLDPAAEAVVADFVAAGGRLVVCGGSDAAGARAAALLNAILGTTMTFGGAGNPNASTIYDAVNPFRGGPGTLPGNTAIATLAGLPGNARVPYRLTDERATVVIIPSGLGEVVFLGWDYFGAPPLGVANEDGWNAVLGRSVLPRDALPTRRVAVYDDPLYVDTDGGSGSESDTVQVSLEALGHEVSTFAGTSSARFVAALAAADALLIPELENGDLAAAMNPEARQAVADFVAEGGVLISHADDQGNGVGFLDSVFGFGLVQGAEFTATEGGLLGFGANGTRFAGGPPALPSSDGSYAIGNLPAGALWPYETPDNVVVVASIPYGAGKVIWLSWDWWDAAPLGSQDGGWLEVLNRAVLEAPEPDAAALGLAAVAALAVLARRRCG